MKKNFLLFLTIFLITGLPAFAGLVTLHVDDSNGDDLSGVQVSYNDYGNHWVTLGTTDANGDVNANVPDGTWDFRALKNYSFQIKNHTVSATPSNLGFQTSEYIAHVKKTDGSDFEGIEVEYNDYGNHYIDLSPQQTDANGNSSIELFPGEYDFRAKKNYSYLTKSLEILTSGTNATTEFQTSKFIAHVKKTDGSDFEGIEVEYNDYGNHYIDLSPQQTDANGNSSIELFPGEYDFRAKKNYSYQTKSLEIPTEGATGTAEFQTATAKALVKDCDNGNPIAGIEVEYNDYGNHYIDLSPQFTDANGNSIMELFPGTFTMRAKTIYTYLEMPITLVNSGDTEIVEFNPSRVCFNYSGSVKYNDYGNHWINLPCDTYMFPGTYDFKFDGYETSVAISGCATGKSFVKIQLKDSGGTGIQGQLAKYYKSGWQTAGTTDANGEINILIDGLLGNTPFKMYYAGGSNQKSQDVSVNSVVMFQTVLVTMQLKDSGGGALASSDAKYYASGWKQFGTGVTETSMELLPNNYPFRVYYGGKSQQKNQDVGSDPVVVFQTILVTMKLLDSGGGALASSDAKYYASGWKQFGSGVTETTMEMLNGTYPFRVYLGGKSEQKNQDIGSDPVVVFQTILVTMKLLDSGGNPIASTNAKYYASGWKTFGSGITQTTMEMLSGTYPFRVYYGGKNEQKNQDIGSDPVVVFQTILVTMKLLDSGGNPIASTNAKYYASGWKTFGSGITQTTMEMLSGTYPFRVYYGGKNEQKNQDIGSDPVVVFQTILVTMKLLDGDNNEIASDDAKYYASGWKTFGSGITTTTMEMLAGNYPFRVYLNGKSIQKNQDVSIDPIVIFTGIPVEIQFTGLIKYYSSGWKTYSFPTNMLPGTYPFRFYDDANSKYVQQNLDISGSEYKKSAAYLRLRTSTGNGISGANSQYYQSGWQNNDPTNSNGAALALLNGLVGNSTFKMYYVGGSNQKSQDISSDSQVEFQTELVSMELKSSTGVQFVSDNAQYYASGWKTFGDGETETSMELLPNVYPFKVYYKGSSNQKSQDVGTDQLVTFETELVSMELKSSTGVQLVSDNAQYYASGWKTFGDGETETSMELLPNIYPFKVYYKGGSNEKSQDVGSNQLVTFETEFVAMELNSSTNVPLASSNAQYYASGWKQFGTGVTPTDMELLPNNYPFKVYYEGGSNQQNQDIGIDPLVLFETSLMTVELEELTTKDPIDGGVVSYYASGWKRFWDYR